MSSPESHEPSSPPPLDLVEQESLNKECKEAVILGGKNFQKALKIADALCSAHSNLSVVHNTRVEVILNHACSQSFTCREKQKLLEQALESAQFSITLSPKNPECTYFYARVLYEMADDDESYMKVVHECLDALGMQEEWDANGECFMKIQELTEHAAGGGLEKQDRIQAPVADALRTSNVDKERKKVLKEEGEKMARDHDFVNKTGEFWRNASFDQKCEILDVSVSDLTSFFSEGDNKDPKALSMMREAIEWHEKTGSWVTWTCYFCGSQDFKDWDGLEKHMDDTHFHGCCPKIEENLTGDFDHLGLDGGNGRLSLDEDELDGDDGRFILDVEALVGNLGDEPEANERFLLDWLRSNADVKMAMTRREVKIMALAEMRPELSELVKKALQPNPEFVAQLDVQLAKQVETNEELQKEIMATKEILGNVLEDRQQQGIGIEEQSKEFWQKFEEVVDRSNELQEKSMEVSEELKKLQEDNMEQFKEEFLDQSKEVKEDTAIDSRTTDSKLENKENLKETEEAITDSQEFHSEKEKPEIVMDSQRIGPEKILQIGSIKAKLVALKKAAMRLSAFDYREALVPCLKFYIQARLNSKVEEAAKQKGDAASKELDELADNEGDKPKWSRKNKNRKGKNKKWNKY